MPFLPADQVPPVKVLPTGIPDLDFALGNGGLPVGKLIEIYGRPGSGKSALAYYIIKSAQDRGLPCAYVNVEGTWDPRWAKGISGMTLSDLDISYPNPGQEAIEDLAEAVDKYKVVVFDSVGALLGEKEQDVKNSIQAGGQSLMVTRMIKAINYPASINECTIIFINQVRDNFASMMGGQESPGGWSIKHTASVRLQVKPGKPYYKTRNGQQVQVGFRVQGKVVKNKYGTPNIVFGYDFWNQPNEDGVTGIDIQSNLADVLTGYDILTKEGNTYHHPALPGGKVVGRPKLIEVFKGDSNVRQALIKEIQEYSIKREEERLKGA